MSKEQDVMITFGADSKAFKAEFDKIQSMIKKNVSGIKSQMSSSKLGFDKFTEPLKKKITSLRSLIAQEKINLGSEFATDGNVLKSRQKILNIQKSINKATAQYRKTQLGLRTDLEKQNQNYNENKKIFSKGDSQYSKHGQGVIDPKVIKEGLAGFDTAQRAIIKSEKEISKESSNMVKQGTANFKKLTATAKKAQIQFQGWAMSIMFFGMALKRVFDTIWKSSTKTFNDVMSSVEGQTTAFQMLEGSVKYLGFSVGQALEPVVAFLLPIIDKVSQWVNKNQALTAGIVIALGVFGTLFSIIGSGVLAVAGFVQAFALLGPAGVSAGAAASAGLAVFMTALGWITLAIGVAILLWKTNFGGFKDGVIAIWESLVENIKLVWSGIVNIVSGIWDILVGIFDGNGNLIIKGILKVLLGVAQASSGIMNFIQDFILNTINFIIQAAIDLATLVPKILLEAMRDTAIAMNLDTSLIDSALRGLEKVRSWDPFESLGINSAVDAGRAAQNKSLEVLGDFIVNIDTADDADSLITQIQDAVSRG